MSPSLNQSNISEHSESLARVVHGFRVINITNRRPLFAILPELGITSRQVSLLFLLLSESKHSIGDMAQLTGLDVTTMSRHIERLRGMKLITIARDPSDSRRKFLTLSTTGRSVCLAYEKENKKSNRDLVEMLSSSEIAEFGAILNQLADSMNAKSFVAPPQAHPLRVPFRRIGEALGLPDENVGGTGLAVSEWHVLGLLAESVDAGLAAISISETLGCPRATLQSILGRLDKQKFISFVRPSSRKRSSGVSITNLGRATFEAAEHALARKLSKGYAQLTRRQRQELHTVLERIVDKPASEENKSTFSFRRIKSDQERGILRGRVIGFLVDNHLTEESGASLLNPEHENFSVWRGQDELAAIFEYSIKSKKISLNNACFLVSLSPMLRKELVQSGLQRLDASSTSLDDLKLEAPYLFRLLGSSKG